MALHAGQRHYGLRTTNYGLKRTASCLSARHLTTIERTCRLRQRRRRRRVVPRRRSLPMRLRMFRCLLVLAALPVSACAEESTKRTEKGTVKFEPLGDQKNIPELYRLEARKFDWEMSLKRELPSTGLTVWNLRYPSP